MKQEQKMLMCCCPFDKNHIIQAKKLQKHIEKCKSPKKNEFIQCKFNPAHWTLAGEANQHLARCQNNIYADKFRIGKNLDISSVSEIMLQQSLQEDNTIIELIMEDKQPNMNIKENRGEKPKKKIFQELHQQQAKKENGLWEQPSFRLFCEQYAKRSKKQKSKVKKPVVVHYDQQDSF